MDGEYDDVTLAEPCCDVVRGLRSEVRDQR